MIRRRKHLLSLAAGLAAVAVGGRAQAADDYPSRTITFINPYAPGGNVDVTARIVGSEMEKLLGRTILVVNKPGATGMIGADFVRRSTPDGYTLLIGSNGPLSSSPVFRKTQYDVERDFVSIGLMSWTPETMVVRDNLPVKTVAEFLDYARTNQVKTASGGIETAPGIAIAQFNMQAKLKFINSVYPGASEYYPALMGSHVDMAFDTLSTSIPMAKSGAVRLLAIADESRSPLAPDVPTFKEAGFDDMVAGAYVGLVAPSATPKPAVAKLRDAFERTMNNPAVKDRLLQLGAVVRDPSAAALDTIVKRETAKARVIKAAQEPGKPN